MTEHYISPNYKFKKQETENIKDWIDIFEDRMKYWIFEQTHFLLQNKHSGYAIIQLIASYFEGITSYQKGQDSEGCSKQFFKEGFISLFPDNYQKDKLENVADILYKDVRCGLFHENMLRDRIFIAPEYEKDIGLMFPKVNGKINTNADIAYIMINPKKFLERVENHFKEYVKKLRGLKNTELRKTFSTYYKLKFRP